MALFIGIDPDLARPSAAIVELDLDAPTPKFIPGSTQPAGAGQEPFSRALPRLRGVCVVKPPAEVSGGFRPLNPNELAIREFCLRLPVWLQKMGVLGPLSISLAVVETSQSHYRGGMAPNWKSVLNNAEMAGACAAILRAYCGCEVLLAQTNEWKRTEPKDISHSRAFEALGILSKAWPKRKGDKRTPFYLPMSPEDRQKLANLSPDTTNPGDWEDISDSVALALWVARKAQQARAAQGAS
jgi:hypothetical protein